MLRIKRKSFFLVLMIKIEVSYLLNINYYPRLSKIPGLWLVNNTSIKKNVYVDVGNHYPGELCTILYTVVCLLFCYDLILLMSTNTWLFKENIWIVNIFMNGILNLFILNMHCDLTLCMTFQQVMLSFKTISSNFSCVMKVERLIFQ